MKLIKPLISSLLLLAFIIIILNTKISLIPPLRKIFLIPIPALANAEKTAILILIVFHLKIRKGSFGLL